jgi:predicted enzyme related to lactoylglutathione lyase
MHYFGHVEIPTTNLKKAQKFYGNLFGWTFQEIPDMDYVLFKTERHPHGGFYLVKRMPKKGQVNVYIEVQDIDSKLKEIKKARGKVVMKKTQIGDMGWFAQFATPDGCMLCLWETAPKEVPAQEPAPQI